MKSQDGVLYSDNLQACVDLILKVTARRVVLAMPLGVGKANHIANALYERAAADPTISLHFITALSFEKPRSSNELSKRFLTPILLRLYGDYADLTYAQARRAGRLPDNIKVFEFFLSPGSLMANSTAQHSTVSLFEFKLHPCSP